MVTYFGRSPGLFISLPVRRGVQWFVELILNLQLRGQLRNLTGFPFHSETLGTPKWTANVLNNSFTSRFLSE
jgi:hypothetical protein